VDASDICRTVDIPKHATFAAGQAAREQLRAHRPVADEGVPGKFAEQWSGIHRVVD